MKFELDESLKEFGENLVERSYSSKELDQSQNTFVEISGELGEN